MSLYRELMLQNAPVLKHHDQFYGQYAFLNKFHKPDSEEIKKYQLMKLRQFQTQSFKKDSKTQQLNVFLQLNGKFNYSNDWYTQQLYERLNNIFTYIDENLIKTGAMTKKVRNNLANNRQKEQFYEFTLAQINNELNQLRSMGMVFNSQHINNLSNLVNALQQDKNIQNLDSALAHLYALKGDTLEEIGATWLNKKIPTSLQTKAISTGNIYGSGGKKLISDLLLIDMENINIQNNVMIDFYIDKKRMQMTLTNFLNFIERQTGETTVQLTVGAEKILKDITLLGIQAKSGYNQLPWNKGSKNTWASIRSPSGKLDTYLKFLEHIQQLYQSTTWDGEKNLRKVTPVYKAMADYSLAQSLNKVLHLSQIDNQYVLTPNGFMPFVSRIIELYEQQDSQYYFSFKGKISLDATEDILVKARPVILGPKRIENEN